MRICFLKDPIEFPQLKIDNQQLELVTSNKVLGLVIQNNLKWNNHIESVVAKASNVSVKSKLQHPPPGHTPGIDAFSCPGGREFDHYS